MSVTFFKQLRGQATAWKDAPPTQQIATGYGSVGTIELTPTTNAGKYTTIDGLSHVWAPLDQFEFLHLGAASMMFPWPFQGLSSFPKDRFVQLDNMYSLPNGVQRPMAGPIDIGRRNAYNNFYGYRVPADGRLLGYTLDFAQTPNDGIFHVFYWSPGLDPNQVNNEGRVSFCPGGPIICPSHPGIPGQNGTPGANGTGEQLFASGSTIFKEAQAIKIQKDGFIFAASDLTYFRNLDTSVGTASPGYLTSVWNTQGWAQTNPARLQDPPSGRTHITVYIRFDEE